MWAMAHALLLSRRLRAAASTKSLRQNGSLWLHSAQPDVVYGVCSLKASAGRSAVEAF